jgi:hypothetical protein
VVGASGEEESAVAQLSHKSVGKDTMNQEDHVEVIDNQEAFKKVRAALPDGDCRVVFDIFSQQGTRYMEFSAKYGNGKAHINHLAEFLRITPRAVNQYKQIIRLQCLANNFTT